MQGRTARRLSWAPDGAWLPPLWPAGGMGEVAGLQPPLHAAASVEAAVPAPTPPAVCTERQQYNSSSGRCDCQAGWGGPGCGACQSDAVCVSYFGAGGATCSGEVAFQQGMQFKAYTCDLTVGAVAAVLLPRSAVAATLLLL